MSFASRDIVVQRAPGCSDMDGMGRHDGMDGIRGARFWTDAPDKS